MVRVVLYLVFIINAGNDISVNLLAITLILCFYAIISNRLSVFKNWPVSVLENCFLINLIFLSCTFLYIKDSLIKTKDGVKILISSGGISLVVLLGIIIYHVYVQLKGNNVLKHRMTKSKRPAPVASPYVQVGLADESQTLALNYGSCECREPLLESVV